MEGVCCDLLMVLAAEVGEAVVALELFPESFLERLHLLGHIPWDVLFLYLQTNMKFKRCHHNDIFVC